MGIFCVVFSLRSECYATENGNFGKPIPRWSVLKTLVCLYWCEQPKRRFCEPDLAHGNCLKSCTLPPLLDKYTNRLFLVFTVFVVYRV